METGEHTNEDGVSIQTTLQLFGSPGVDPDALQRLTAGIQRNVEGCYGLVLEKVDGIPLRLHGVYYLSDELSFEYHNVAIRFTVNIHLPRQVSAVDLIQAIYWLKSAISHSFQLNVDSLMANESESMAAREEDTVPSTEEGPVPASTSFRSLLDEFFAPLAGPAGAPVNPISDLFERFLDGALPKGRPSGWPSDVP